MPQSRIPAVVMRGGTSRGVFFKAADLPDDLQTRTAIFLEVMGSPDPLQVDGLGGTHSSTSKVMVVDRSAEPDCDVEYSLGQVAVGAPEVHYRSNCGSLATAVAAFSIDEGLVDDVREPETTVRLRDCNTGVRMHARVPVQDGRARLSGDWMIAGIDRPGAPIVATYLDPGGAITGSVLPTGAPRDELEVPDLGMVPVSIVDVTCVTVFVEGLSLGLTGRDDPTRVNSDPELLARVEAVRAACAVRIGLAADITEATRRSPQQPKITVCAPPADEGASLDVRTFSMGRMHAAFPVTGMLCTGAAAAIPGTIPHQLRSDPDQATARLRHARGTMSVDVNLLPTDGQPVVENVSIVQTARRIFEGSVLIGSVG